MCNGLRVVGACERRTATAASAIGSRTDSVTTTSAATEVATASPAATTSATVTAVATETFDASRARTGR
jgi:hypothetical protein